MRGYGRSACGGFFQPQKKTCSFYKRSGLYCSKEVELPMNFIDFILQKTASHIYELIVLQLVLS
jgi:hypothetical protein